MSPWLHDASLRWLAPLLGVLSACAGQLLQRLGIARAALPLLHFASRQGMAGATIAAIAENPASGLAGQLSLIQSPEPESMAIERSIVLRLPRVTPAGIEKGVLVVTFTNVASYFLKCSDLALLTRFFHVVLEPSWSGYADPQILAWARLDAPVFVMASEVRDRVLIDSLASSLVSLSIGAGDWVDDRLFHPIPGCGKRYDALQVTNHSVMKRTHAFLAAVREARRRDAGFRAAVVFAAFHGTPEQGDRLVARYGLEDVVDVYHSLPASDLNRVLNESRATLLLSLKEGSSRIAFESMFAGTPVVLLAENVGVNKAYVNESTGLVVTEARLPAVLLSLRERSARFAPRAWAERNISAERSTAKLAEAIAGHAGVALAAKDLAVKVNRPEAEYRDHAHEDKITVNTALLPALRRGGDAAGVEAVCRELSRRFPWL